MIQPYPKIFSFGKPEVAPLVGSSVIIQEKVDGSQFSFGLRPHPRLEWKPEFRSKNQMLDIENPDKMFRTGIESITNISSLLKPNWIYRGEYLQKSKHNTLCYSRVPAYNVILFDIQDELGRFLPQGVAQEEARRIGLEYVPSYVNENLQLEQILDSLNAVSILGGSKVEGIVVKDHTKSSPLGGPLMAKHVSEEFKEVHRGDWRDRNPTHGDIVDQIIATYKTPARWNKAIQHLRDAGTLLNDPKDIGPLLGEVAQDVFAEEAEEIKNRLFEHAWKRIAGGITKGLPDWYKQKLLEATFDGSSEVKS